MDSELHSWLQAQTWPDLRPDVLAAASAAFWHPYGFIVVRLDVHRFTGWGVRIHLWPEKHSLSVPYQTQYIHRHGWELLSRTLVGAVRHTTYSVAPDSRADPEWCEYAVISDPGVGQSMLSRVRCGLGAEETGELRSSPDSDLTRVRAIDFHSTAAEVTGVPWSVTVAATATHREATSAVLAPVSTPTSYSNPRKPAGEIASLLTAVDASYRKESGIKDRWIASVFLARGDKILVVRTHRFPQYWQPVGGQSASEDADPLSTAIREVREEIGLEVDPSALIPLGSARRDRGEGLVFAYAAEAGRGWEPIVLESEIVDHKWMTHQELLAADTFGATRHFAQVLAAHEMTD